MPTSATSARFVKKARAEYDGYLLIEDDYIKESFRISFENTRDISNEIDSLTTTVTDLASRLVSLETKLTSGDLTSRVTSLETRMTQAEADHDAHTYENE